MEKRTLLFIVISLLVIIVWDYLFIPKKNVQQQPNTSQTVSNKADQPQPTNFSNTKFEKTPPPNITTKELKTELFQGFFVKEDGFFKKLLLNKYTFDKTHKQLVDIMREGFVDIYDVIYIEGNANKINYSNIEISEKSDVIQIVLMGEIDAIKVKKTLTIDKNNYSGVIGYSFVSSDKNLKNVVPGFKIIQKFKGVNTSEEGNPAPHFFANKSYESPSERQLKKVFKSTNVLYGGVAEKYFALFFIDPKEAMYIESTLQDEHVATNFFLPALNLENDKETAYELKFYAGPKKPEILKAVGYHLDAAVDYGFFHFIARPLLVILNFFYKYTQNYGISIILLTILIKLAFFPLSHKSYKSMKALQKLQPKMEELRKKYANDKEALNREMMLLYKRYGVNPLSGCLPMLVQIPFFIALYQALMNAIELRQAPFMFWLNDLSAKDPYYVTPLLMGATMLIQQILTPSSGDPTQKKMMYIMPVVFTFMFLNFPSGLVLYWLINNIFSIFQQLYTIKKQEA